MTERDITICGHGSNVPSLKNLYQYNEMRYNGKMSNGVRKGLLRVRRLKALDTPGKLSIVPGWHADADGNVVRD